MRPIAKLYAKFIEIAVLACLIVLISCSSNKKQGPFTSSRVIGGEKWLSWTPNERERYVYGYLDGYFSGYGEACEFVMNLDLRYAPEEKNKEDEPFKRCNKSRREYSKAKFIGVEDVDVSFYSTMLTELYERHADARSAPFVLLLRLMYDGGATDSEQRYKAQIGKWPNARTE